MAFSDDEVLVKIDIFFKLGASTRKINIIEQYNGL
tara:strand:- start:18 stop:122 length:105 start_codon:yes stop_codon:yes gene_type:complete